MPNIYVNDINLYYEQSGSGPDLVLISGLGADHTMWNVSKFTNDFRVLTFDNRGIGQSDVPTSPYTMETLAQDTVALCHALNIKKAHFVGHSMGGHTAQYIAALHPDLVDKLILACSEQEISVVASLATKTQIDFRKQKVHFKTMIDAFLPIFFTIDFLEKKSNVEKFIQKNLSNPNPMTDQGYIGQVEALHTHNSKHLLHKITSPTLVIGCREDLITPFKNSEYLSKHIPNAKLHEVRNSGHAFFIEQPEEFIKIIFDFLIKE